MELAAGAVTRSIDLPAPIGDTWESIRDAEGLAGWLGDSVEFDDLGGLVAGAAGTVRDADAVRRLVVTEVEEGRSIGFVWWDDAAPELASVVTISLTPASDDGAATSVTVTERFAGSASASASMSAASVADLVEVSAGWDRRLQALVGRSALAPAFV